MRLVHQNELILDIQLIRFLAAAVFFAGRTSMSTACLW